MPKIPTNSNAAGVNMQGASSLRQTLSHRPTASRTPSQTESFSITTTTQQTPTISTPQPNQRVVSAATNEVPPSSASEQNQSEANASKRPKSSNIILLWMH